MLVDRGSDWSPIWQEQLDQYVSTSTSQPGQVNIWSYRSRGKDKTTLALNIFRGETRDFEYVTPKVRIHLVDLLMPDPATGRTGLPEVIHLVCSPERAALTAAQAKSYADGGQGAVRLYDHADQLPSLLWEPMPSDAIPQNLHTCLALFDQVLLFSPNHEEAACLLSTDLPPEGEGEGEDDNSEKAMISAIEGMVTKLLRLASENSQLTRTPVIALRSGKRGTFIEPAHLFHGEKRQAPSRSGFWVPAYHDRSMAHRVVDVTGGGNGWLGGFAAGIADALARHTKLTAMTDKEILLRAGVRGSVSACKCTYKHAPDFGPLTTCCSRMCFCCDSLHD